MNQGIIDISMRTKDWLKEMDWILIDGDSNPDLIMLSMRNCANARLIKGTIIGSAGTIMAGVAIKALTTIAKRRRSKKAREA